jgi:hypothetical protein
MALYTQRRRRTRARSAWVGGPPAAPSHERQAAISGTGAIATAAIRVHVRSAAVSGTGTVAVAGTVVGIRSRSADVSGTGSITVAARTVVHVRSAAVSGTGTIESAGSVVAVSFLPAGKQRFRSASGLGVGGNRWHIRPRGLRYRWVGGGAAADHERQVAVSGTGTITTAGIRVHARSAAVSGTGTVATAGIPVHVRSAAISGTGTIATTAIRVHVRSAAVSGTGSIATTGQVATAPSLLPAGRQRFRIASGLAGGRGNRVHIRRRPSRYRWVGGLGTQSLERSVAIGLHTVVGPPPIGEDVPSTISVSGQRIHARSVALSGTGTITTVPETTGVKQRAAAISGTGSITVAATVRVHVRAAAIAGVGSISTAGEIAGALQRTVAITGTGTIATVGRRVLLRSTAVSGTSSITVDWEIEGPQTRAVAITGTGSITVAHRRVLIRSIAVTGTGLISTVPQRRLQRAVAIAGTSSIQTSSTVIGPLVAVGIIESGSTVAYDEGADTAYNFNESTSTVAVMNE